VSLLRTLLAFVSGVVAALIWLERKTSPSNPPAAPGSEPAPSQSGIPADSPPEPERVVEQVVVADPDQAAKIEALEAALAEQQAIRVSEPGEAPPSVDAIRTARARAFELERQLARQREDDSPRWFEIDPPAADELIDAAAEHLPRVAVWVEPEPSDPGELWRVLGAMQEFAEASGGAWFEFDGEFARWCRESGHPHALDPEQAGADDLRPEFPVESRVNRSGRMVVPNFVEVGDLRLHYVDDVAGETGRMHVVGLG
jgi:hypothetical protein